jgi:hypothetical protein
MTGLRGRRILIAAIAVAVVAVLVLLLPPVQTGLARRLASGIEGAEVSLERVSAGPWGAELRGLTVAAPGVQIEVPQATVDLAFWSSLGHLAIDVEQATASGIRIGVGRLPERSDGAAEPVEFNGLGPLARLPKRFVVRRLEAEGSIELILSDEVVVAGPWTLEASGLGPDRRAEASIEATLEGRRDAEPFAAAVVTASSTAVVAGDGVITRLTAGAGLRAASDEPRGIDADVTAELAKDVEIYRFSVDTSSDRRMVDATARFEPGARQLEASWTTEITPGQLADFARGRPLPELAAMSTGTATLDFESGRVEIDARGRLEGRGWAELDPRLGEVGDLVAEADLSASLDDLQLEARRLRIALTSGGGREILRVTALQPVLVDRAAWRFVPQTWGEPALRFEADRYPLHWFRGFDSSVRVEAGEISAAIDIVPMGSGHTVVATSKPIRVADLKLRAADDRGVTPDLDLEVVPRISLDDGVLELAIDRAQLTATTGLDVRFSGRATTSRGEWPVVGLDGDLSLVLPGLQRLVGSLDRVTGSARFELDLGAMVLAADRAALDVTEPGGRSLLAMKFENDEPLRLALPAMTPDWDSAAPQSVDLVVDGFPVAWLGQFIPELELRGGALYGELRAVTGGGLGLTLEPTAPFELRDLQPVYRDRPFAGASTASVEPRLTLDNSGARIALENFRVRTPSRGRLDGEAVLEAPRDGRRRINATIFVEGEFPSVTDRIGRLGALSWRQEAVIDVASRQLEVTDLEVGLTDAAGTRFLELRTLRPFRVTADPFGVRVDDGSPDILRATITPLELGTLFPRILGFQLEGVLPQGQFVGRAENGGLVLAADEPLVFRDVSVRWENAALLDRVTVGLQYQVLYSAQGLEARSIDFSTLGPGGTPIAEGTLRAAMPLTDRTTIESLHFDAEANLEPLTRQPVFRGLPAFLEGTVAGSVDLSYGDRATLRGSLEMRGARAESEGALPDLEAALEVLSVAGERFEITAPLRLVSETGGRSDLSFEGEVVRHGDDRRFEASLTGERIAAADVMRLAHLVAPPDPDARETDPREPVTSAFRERWSEAAIGQLRERRDETPVWGDRMTGRAELAIDTIQLEHYAVRGIRGRLEVDPSRVELVGAGASLFGADLTMAGALGFDRSAELPYELHFESAFENLDLGRVFLAVEPDAPPILEGVFEVRSSATGRGRNLADLGLGSLGWVRLSGRDGIFRGLAGRFGVARTGAKVIGFLTFSKQLKAIGRLLGELEALEFDAFDLELARVTPHRFAITELAVLSPLARIDGGGGIEVEAGVPLVESALDASFDMAARGDMTILFDGLGLLEDAEDGRGYRPLTRPVTVGGTVAEPDTSDFYEMLDEAAKDSKGVVGVAMRRANKKLQKGR